MADNVIVVENNNHLFRNKIRFDGKDENRHILEENMQADEIHYFSRKTYDIYIYIYERKRRERSRGK